MSKLHIGPKISKIANPYQYIANKLLEYFESWLKTQKPKDQPQKQSNRIFGPTPQQTIDIPNEKDISFKSNIKINTTL